MKRKTSVILLLIGLLLSYTAYSKGYVSLTLEEKYEDAKLVLTDLAVLIEAFVENMDESDHPEEVAKVLDTFTESMKELVPKISEIRKKNPELSDEETHPEELKAVLQRVDKDFQQMMKAYAKVNANMEDPVVKEADARYKKVMSGLR
jgi:uncharacterized UPF0160 family protein